ncbi:TRAP transporter large permease subunit [Chloroflexota bacterium]
MDWWVSLVIIFGSLILLFSTGIPVAFGFMVINVVGVFIFWGGEVGLRQLTLSMFDSVTTFTLLPFPLFVLMGEILFQAGLAGRGIEAIDKLLGRLPGRLSLLSVASGVLLAALTGSSMASCAVLGSLLVPEMEKRGYKKTMTIGPILGSGCLAIMIPPSGLAVLTASLALISVGGLLMAGIIPGLIMAALFAGYIVIRCWLQPSLAPSYRVPPIPLAHKVGSAARDILPLGFVIFLVIGLIFLGIATPSEAAATGALGSFILAACYRSLNWEIVKRSVLSATKVAGMIMIILAGSTAFSQVLVFSGGTAALIKVTAGLTLPPIVIIISMMAVLIFLGCLMDQVSMLMICLPIFMPVIQVLGFNELWFGLLLLINVEMGTISPPFGMTLFVMKGVAPPDTTTGDLYRGAIPFLIIDLIVMGICMAFPQTALWLPSLIQA